MNKQIIAVDFHCKYQKVAWPVVKTAVARKLPVCCYILLRDEIDYPEFVRRGRGLGLPDAGTGPSMTEK